MLGETLRPSAGKWNNTFNHMKHSAQDYFCTYFLSPGLFDWTAVSRFVFLSIRFCSLRSPSRKHTLPLQMSTAINREFLLNPLYTHAHRRAQWMTHYKTELIVHVELHRCAFQEKYTTRKTVQYNYNWFYRNLCELLLVINCFFFSPMSLGVFDKYTSVSASERGTLACSHQSGLNQWQPHTLSSSFPPFNSVKTDVHTDKPSLHPSLGEEEQGEKEETILHLPTLPASQHTN